MSGAAATGHQIAIVGMAGRFPRRRDRRRTFWRNLRDGVESVSLLHRRGAARAPASIRPLIAIPRYVRRRAALDDIDDFDAGFFGFTPARGGADGSAAPLSSSSAPGRRSRTPATTPDRCDGLIGVFAGAA